MRGEAMTWLSSLWVPLQFDFVQQGMVMAALVALPMALLSCLLVLKGWALLGDAIAHGVFPGVVLAYLLGWPVLPGAFAAGMACALLSGYLQANSRIRQDTLMGVVFSGMFALGLLLHSWVRASVHLDHLLFGDLLGAGWGEVAEVALLAGAITLWMALQWRDLMLHAFDATQARAVGLRVRLLHYGLLAAVSLAVVAALKAVGVVLAVALLIAPGATALLWVRRFGPMLLLASALAVTCAVLGVYVSFMLDSAPAATIVLVMSAAFVFSLLWQAVVAHMRRA
ncbi:metal ABC transporter permease [Allofranklinella schreckenbergeri]|nr:metal ABC transporter permease [Allofranklinella schreckenbergeri]